MGPVKWHQSKRLACVLFAGVVFLAAYVVTVVLAEPSALERFTPVLLILASGFAATLPTAVAGMSAEDYIKAKTSTPAATPETT